MDFLFVLLLQTTDLSPNYFIIKIGIFCFRYGSQADADELNSLYGDSRADGFGPEVNFLSCAMNRLHAKPLM